MSRTFQTIESSACRLRGIVHCAGVLDDGVILHQTAARMERVLAAKAHGSWNLHRFSLAQPLDFFVIFSSGSSLMGSPGQSNHSAANAYMDALAHFRSAHGLPALSINWGAWGSTGAAMEAVARERIGGSGLRSIAPADGLAVMESLLNTSEAQRAVLPIDWPQFVRAFPEAARLSTAFRINGSSPARPARRRPPRAQPSRRMGSGISGAGWNLKLRESWDWLCRKNCLRDRPLSDLGLDSLMAVELRNALSRVVAKPLPASLAFNYPTIDALTAFLTEQISPLVGNCRCRSRTDGWSPATSDSDDEEEAALELMLAAKLKAIR